MRTAMLALLVLACLVPNVGCVGARGACAGCQNCDHGGGCVRNGFFARHFGPGARHGHFADGTGLHRFGHDAHYARHVTPTQEGIGAPPSAQVAYPYYSNRGPRDFLVNDPPSIGY